jgi:hypothetical protein
MLQLKGKLLGVTELEGRNGFPPSSLITVYDEVAGETLNLVGPREVVEKFAASDSLSDVTLTLRWRRMDLAALGGSGRGKAYRLSVVGGTADE